MSSGATLGTLEQAHVVPAPSPVVWLDGAPTQQLSVAIMTHNGWLDEREAVLQPVRTTAGHERQTLDHMERLIGRPIAIMQPIALSGGEHRWLPRLRGRIVESRQSLDGQTDRLALIATDAWNEQLTRPIQISELDGTWNVATLIEQLNKLADLRLAAPLLPAEVTGERTIPTGRTVGRVLETLLQSHALVVQRTLRWDGRTIGEHRTIRARRYGRAVRLGFGQIADAAASIAALAHALPQRKPIKLIAEAAGRVIESTFTLQPGWDAADENLADPQYAPSTSNDFDAVANVFRLWVLNEDASQAGEPFDLTLYFNAASPIKPRALRFVPCLTRDEAGRSFGVVVDISTDAGVTWHRHAGRTRVLNDRAGVYFDDEVLPTGWIDAVRTASARVRVTASLRSPLPLTAVRWRGNPFAGPFVTQRYRLGNRYAWHSVAPGSKYSSDVVNGVRQADAIDQRDAMTMWLASQRPAAHIGSARISTIGVATALRIGDRLDALTGRSMTAALHMPGGQSVTAALRRIEHRWSDHTSHLQWHVSGSS